jgi:hypothetical protein
MPTPSDAGSLSTLSLIPTVGREKGVNTDNEFKVSPTVNINPDVKMTSQVVTWSMFNRPYIMFIKDQAWAAIADDTVEGSLLAYDAGTKQPDGERVRISTSPTSIAIVGYGRDNKSRQRTNGYVQYSLGNVMSPVVMSYFDNYQITDTAYFGGRFLFSNFSGEAPSVYYSDIGSVEPSGLDFFAPDNLTGAIKGIEVDNDILYVFGDEQTFLYQITSSTDIPFRNTGEINVGLYQPESKFVTSQGVYFIGKDGGNSYHIYRISGASVQKISSRQVDYFLNKNNLYDTYDTADATYPDYCPIFKITDNNKSIICFNTPVACLCYDEETGMWHERKNSGRDDWDVVGYEMSVRGPVFISDTWDFLGPDPVTPSNDLYDMNTTEPNINSGLENGEIMERVMISAPFNDGNQRMMVDELQPQCEVDYSEPVTDWAEAKISLSVSHDFGNTFEQERALNIGRAGNYTQETRFFNIGYYTQAFTLKLRSMNPYPTKVIKLLARLTTGGS